MEKERKLNEKSCGAVVFSGGAENRRYILVREANGFWCFPKGHMEAGETEEETALREVLEETGADVRLIGGFRMTDEYALVREGRPDVTKQVVYFLAQTDQTSFQPRDQDEITEVRLMDAKSALAAFRMERFCQILLETELFLNGLEARQSQERTAASLRRFDNHDARLPYYELMLERELKDLPDFPLPDGYGLELYAPGDRDAWIDIEKSAREFDTRVEGEEAWKRFYEGHDDELRERMFFAVSPTGEKAATATAYYDIRSGDDGITGWLHWVAVRREEQGRGLSKPLIACMLRKMQSLGYRRAVVPTQTTTWLACKVYLDLGFRPIPKNAERNRAGWEIVRTLTDHPALRSFAETDVDRFLTGSGKHSEKSSE